MLDADSDDDAGKGRKRFFKSIYAIDASARRKRKAKFARALLGLMDTYGMDIAFVHGVVKEMAEEPSVLEKHASKRARMAAGSESGPPASARGPQRRQGAGQASLMLLSEAAAAADTTGKRTRAGAAVPAAVGVSVPVEVPVPVAPSWSMPPGMGVAHMFGSLAAVAPSVHVGGDAFHRTGSVASMLSMHAASEAGRGVMSPLHVALMMQGGHHSQQLAHADAASDAGLAARLAAGHVNEGATWAQAARDEHAGLEDELEHAFGPDFGFDVGLGAHTF